MKQMMYFDLFSKKIFVSWVISLFTKALTFLFATYSPPHVLPNFHLPSTLYQFSTLNTDGRRINFSAVSLENHTAHTVFIWNLAPNNISCLYRWVSIILGYVLQTALICGKILGDFIVMLYFHILTDVPHKNSIVFFSGPWQEGICTIPYKGKLCNTLV